MTDRDLSFDELYSLPDEELAGAAKNGKAAAEALVLRYSKLILVKANLLADQSSDVDDLCQEGLIGLMSAAGAYDAGRNAKFSTFAEVCITNRMKSFLARSRRVSASQSLDEMDEEQLPDNETPESVLISREFFAELRYAVDHVLSDSERQVFYLCVRGASYAETAEKLGISVKSVDNAMQRARRKIREHCGGRSI